MSQKPVDVTTSQTGYTPFKKVYCVVTTEMFYALIAKGRADGMADSTGHVDLDALFKHALDAYLNVPHGKQASKERV